MTWDPTIRNPAPHRRVLSAWASVRDIWNLDRHVSDRLIKAEAAARDMRVRLNEDGTADVTLVPGDEIAPGLIYQGEDVTHTNVPVTDNTADLGDWGVQFGPEHVDKPPARRRKASKTDAARGTLGS